MDPILELSVYRLIMTSSLFTKLILGSLIVLSVLSWAVMLHKYSVISRYRLEIGRFLKTLNNQANLSYIEDSAAHFSSGIAKTMPVLLIRLVRSKKQSRLVLPPVSIINNALMHESGKLQQGMTFLATTANISPLIGLLGTVWGVMYAFMNIGTQGSASIAVVAPGIAEALMTTIAGLCVAIPAMTGYNLLSGRVNGCLDILDRVAEYMGSILKVM